MSPPLNSFMWNFRYANLLCVVIFLTSCNAFSMAFSFALAIATFFPHTVLPFLAHDLALAGDSHVPFWPLSVHILHFLELLVLQLERLVEFGNLLIMMTYVYDGRTILNAWTRQQSVCLI